MRRERLREVMSTPPSPEHIRQMAEEGWNLAAVEWERLLEEEAVDAGRLKEEIPFGLRVATDCEHLEEDPVEKEALVLMLELIVEDRSLSEIASGLNREDMQTRHGAEWDQSSVFYMLPRLIEVAPQIFASENWSNRRLDVAARMEQLLR